MSGGVRVAMRLTGAALVVGAFAGLYVAGAPGTSAPDFGAAPAEPTGSAPADAGRESGNDAEREPEPERGSEPGREPSPFTTTAPRGAMDPTSCPAAVRIATLDVAAPVMAVGVGTEGALIVPHSPMDVGWYQGGAVPGEPGVALLTSHVDTRTEGRGVFAGLVDLTEGDTVTVVTAAGAEQRWTVTARTQHRKTELPPSLFARAGQPVLALVTCGGPFDPTSRSYRDNVIVWAQRSD